jgi:uncharacterized protein
MATPTFIADVHLGRLAKMLRMMGIDTAYQNDYTKDQLLIQALNESRILLSRNAALASAQGIRCFIITSEQPEMQLKAVLDEFTLKDKLQPFTRCLLCNGTLHQQPKEAVRHLLQPNTANYFNEFWQCSTCNHIYWKGSHYDRMLQLIKRME